MLRLSPETAAARGEFGQERYERTDFQHQVRTKSCINLVVWLAKMHDMTWCVRRSLPKVAQQFELLREPWWTDIDASHSQDVVAEHVLAAAMTAVKHAKDGVPLRTLWQ